MFLQFPEIQNESLFLLSFQIFVLGFLWYIRAAQRSDSLWTCCVQSFSAQESHSQTINLFFLNWCLGRNESREGNMTVQSLPEVQFLCDRFRGLNSIWNMFSNNGHFQTYRYYWGTAILMRSEKQCVRRRIEVFWRHFSSLKKWKKQTRRSRKSEWNRSAVVKRDRSIPNAQLQLLDWNEIKIRIEPNHKILCVARLC